MEWSGNKHRPMKYANSTWKDTKIGFVQIVKNAHYDEDGDLIEGVSVTLYDEDENMMESYIPASGDISQWSLADYTLCDIQDDKDINVQK